jgi:AraC-like DNA-binding protein
MGQSFQSGREYISVCPGGLVEFTVPLIRSGRLAGGVAGGFALFPEMKQESGKSGRIDSGVGTMKTGALRLLAERAFKSAYDASGQDRPALDRMKERYDRQFRIAGEIERIKTGREDPTAALIRRQDELRERILKGDQTGAREMLNEFLGAVFFETGMNFEVVKMRLAELVIVLSRSAVESGADGRRLLGTNYAGLLGLFRADTADELCDAVTVLLEGVIRQMAEGVGLRARRPEIRKAEESLRADPARRISVDDLASCAGLSPSRFVHLFKSETGLSVTDYTLRLRVLEARRLLLKSDLPIAEIAMETGFYDQSHLTRHFRRFEKTTPDRFRKKFDI